MLIDSLILFLLAGRLEKAFFGAHATDTLRMSDVVGFKVPSRDLAASMAAATYA